MFRIVLSLKIGLRQTAADKNKKALFLGIQICILTPKEIRGSVWTCMTYVLRNI